MSRSSNRGVKALSDFSPTLSAALFRETAQRNPVLVAVRETGLMWANTAGVPRWEGSDQRREAVDLDAALPRSLRPGELAGVPFDESFGVRGDVDVLIDARARLADLGVSELRMISGVRSAKISAPRAMGQYCP